MIKDFRNLAANERTYLAWVRTAICVMAFGYLVEKFDLFVRYSLHQKIHTQNHFNTSAIIGVALMFTGLFVIIFASIRFLTHQKLLRSDSAQTRLYAKLTIASDLFLAILLFLLGLSTIIYMIHLIF